MNKTNLKRAYYSLKILILTCVLPGYAMAGTDFRDFDLANFDRIHVLAPYQLEVVQDDEFSVGVTVDDEHTNDLDVYRTQSTLILSVQPDRSNFKTLGARVTLPALDSIEIIGAGKAELSGFSQQKLSVHILGVGRVSGSSLWADELDLSVIGTGGVDFGRAGPFQDAKILLDGVNESTLNMAEGSKLHGLMVGVTRLNYWGTDVSLDVFKIGLGKIKRLGPTWNGQSPAPSPAPTPIDFLYSGSWYNPGQSGHGFSIEIGRKPNGTPLAIVYWYVFDDFGNPIFLVGSGVPDGNVLEVEFKAPLGMAFGEFDPQSVERKAAGTARFEFSGHDNGTFSYTPSEFSILTWGHSSIEALSISKLFAIDFQ
ncbi:MAG: DUF2807 domain-containing protein [Xanthomonadales bacterium]|nr:DUF2807 domain-containing protein [Xanthomonadales bacterium]